MGCGPLALQETGQAALRLGPGVGQWVSSSTSRCPAGWNRSGNQHPRPRGESLELRRVLETCQGAPMDEQAVSWPALVGAPAASPARRGCEDWQAEGLGGIHASAWQLARSSRGWSWRPAILEGSLRPMCPSWPQALGRMGV